MPQESVTINDRSLTVFCSDFYFWLTTDGMVDNTSQPNMSNGAWETTANAILTLARKRCFATFAHAGGVGATPPGV